MNKILAYIFGCMFAITIVLSNDDILSITAFFITPAEATADLPVPNPLSLPPAWQGADLPETPPEPVAEPPLAELMRLNLAEYHCLALNIYWEGRNRYKEDSALIPIGLVALTRVDDYRWGSSICEVLFEAKKIDDTIVEDACQFSWYCDGKSDDPDLSNPIELAAWEKAKVIARGILMGVLDDPIMKVATHYHAYYANPSWAEHERVVFLGQRGDHLFYREGP